MVRTVLKMLGASSCAWVLGSCGGAAGKVDAWQSATSSVTQSEQRATSLDGVTVPVLRSEGLEKVWGAPEISKDGQGGWMLTYRNPGQSFSKLMIYGMTTPLPGLASPPKLGGEEMVNDQLTGFSRPQEWREVVIADKKVRWYQESTSGGADGAYYSTEGFTLKSPDGRTGHYRLVAEDGDDTAVILRWFGSVGFP